MSASRILFVDDQPNVLSGLRRILHSKRSEWEMDFAGGGQEALRLLESNPYDLVVSDMRMPGMDGAELLAEVRERHPETVRIILSGQADREAVLRSAGVSHQFLSKPCDTELLTNTISRALSVRGMMASERLRTLVSGLHALPSLPKVYQEFMRELEQPECSVSRIAEIISRDIGLTAKINQVTNSGYFGLRQSITRPLQAVQILGLDLVKALVLSHGIFYQFERNDCGPFSVTEIWRHSLHCGALCQAIARDLKLSDAQEGEAFLAGLLHDVGMLVLVANLPDEYARLGEQTGGNGPGLHDSETKLLGANHAEVGAYLLALWGLAAPVVEAIAAHHRPAGVQPGHSDLAVILHAANALAHYGCGDLPEDPCAIPYLSAELVSARGLAARLRDWQAINCSLHRAAGA